MAPAIFPAMRRALRILAVVLPFALSFRRDLRRWLAWGAPVPRTPAFHQRRAERLVAAIAGLGPTFIKLAQVFAGRADLMPEVYARKLTRLTDQVPAVPWPAIAAQVEAAYGRPVAEVFDRMDQAPVASASLGQVHRGSCRGKDVAIKVLRPGVERLVARDLAAAAGILGRVVRWWPHPQVRAFQRVVAEFRARIHEEMDFRHEAANADRVRENFRDRRHEVVIPEVVHELTRQRVLVLEFVEGRRVDRLDDWIASGRVAPGLVVERVIALFARMMLVDGFFHADPHPGNLLLAEDGRIVLLDFGMVVEVPVLLRRELVRAVYASVRRDHATMTDCFFTLGLVEPDTDRETIHTLVRGLFELAARQGSNRDRVRQLTDQVMAEFHSWPVVLPGHLVYVARTASLIEGLGVRYDPMYNPLLQAAPVVLRLYPEAMQALAGPAAERRRAGEGWPEWIGGALGRAAAAVLRTGAGWAADATRRLGPALTRTELGRAAGELLDEVLRAGWWDTPGPPLPPRLPPGDSAAARPGRPGRQPVG